MIEIEESVMPEKRREKLIKYLQLILIQCQSQVIISFVLQQIKIIILVGTILRSHFFFIFKPDSYFETILLIVADGYVENVEEINKKIEINKKLEEKQKKKDKKSKMSFL